MQLIVYVGFLMQVNAPEKSKKNDCASCGSCVGDRSQRVNAKVETIEMVVVERMKQGIIFGILIMGNI